MRQDYWPLGTWGRIPVTMHWTVLLSFAWLYLIFFDVVATLVAVPFLFLLFVAHEYGHVVMLRRRKIAVTGIALFGIHGETSYNEYSAKPADVVAVAWAGVAAQLLVMLLALAAVDLVPFATLPLGSLISAVIFVVLVKVNVFLMIIALLPIGPFDGHAAWQVIPRMRAKLRRPRKAKPVPPAPPPEPDVTLSPEQQRELDAASERAAAELMAKLTGKSGTPTDRDRRT
jgi:Zn-dependent protease